jgi:hypothetical protein
MNETAGPGQSMPRPLSFLEIGKMLSCPCWHARIGAGLLTFCLSIAFAGHQTGAYLLALRRGDISPVMAVWVGLALLGVGLFLRGLRAARDHADEFSLGSFVWSVLVIALGVAALRDQTYLVPPMSADAIVIGKAFWLGWIANNIVNIWLQLRGLGGRRSDLPDYLQPPRRSLFGFRRRTIKITEWTAGNAPMPDYQPPAASPPAHASPVIDHDGAAPQIGYLDGNGNFIPVQLPPASVPVSRRLR